MATTTTRRTAPTLVRSTPIAAATPARAKAQGMISAAGTGLPPGMMRRTSWRCGTTRSYDHHRASGRHGEDGGPTALARVPLRTTFTP